MNTLQSHVSFLRRILASKAAIRARPPGYLLDLAGDGTDVRLAERLFRQGQQSVDPLRGAAFQRLRRTLAEELEIDPSRELRDLETGILRQDPALDAPATTAGLTRAIPRVPIPAQLPPAVPVFAGRGAELARLDAPLPPVTQEGPDDSAAAVIAALSGTAGVGKTALAVHWAHRVAGNDRRGDDGDRMHAAARPCAYGQHRFFPALRRPSEAKCHPAHPVVPVDSGGRCWNAAEAA